MSLQDCGSGFPYALGYENGEGCVETGEGKNVNLIIVCLSPFHHQRSFQFGNTHIAPPPDTDKNWGCYMEDTCQGSPDSFALTTQECADGCFPYAVYDDGNEACVPTPPAEASDTCTQSPSVAPSSSPSLRSVESEGLSRTTPAPSSSPSVVVEYKCWEWSSDCVGHDTGLEYTRVANFLQQCADWGFAWAEEIGTGMPTCQETGAGKNGFAFLFPLKNQVRLM